MAKPVLHFHDFNKLMTCFSLFVAAAGVRMHYGHPDIWRRSFVATCGGVSKANRGLHVSEDVFGGYNVLLRGRHIQFVDYISVGKGRDMGLESINTFEGKVSGQGLGLKVWV